MDKTCCFPAAVIIFLTYKEVTNGGFQYVIVYPDPISARTSLCIPYRYRIPPVRRMGDCCPPECENKRRSVHDAYDQCKHHRGCFQLCRKVKIYKGIIDSPRLNETVPVFYRPVSGSWIPRREVTYWWILFSIFALISFAVGGIFLVKGRQVLVGISDYHVDHPNVYGNLLYITAGFLMFTAGVLCIRFLLPLCLQPLFRPLIIAVKHLAVSGDRCPLRRNDT